MRRGRRVRMTVMGVAVPVVVRVTVSIVAVIVGVGHRKMLHYNISDVQRRATP
jgi:hypothetical protein